MLDSLLIKIIPGFKKHWEQDDIYKAADGGFTPHDVMGSFLDFYQHNFESLSRLQLSTLCVAFEEIVSSDTDDSNNNANAICTIFLECLVDTSAGNKLAPYLGVRCKRYWDCYKS